MKPFQIAPDIYWVGAVDWNIRDFHGYSTPDGTTYNAYLILDEKVTLIDTVKNEFAEEALKAISEIVDLRKIDIVISNHTEMDHSGGLPRFMHRIGEDKPVYCSKMGFKNLKGHFRSGLNYQPVDDGQTINIGKRTLTFLETRMLHWPDSMFTYLNEEKILFSSDAFGQHYAGVEHFDDEIGDAILPHAAKYYANILLLYSTHILNLMEKVKKLGTQFKMICPDHGVVWRKDPGKIVNAYVEWALQKPKKKVVVVYDTMWHSTQKMAEAIVDSLGQEGVQARCMHARAWHRSDIMTEVLEAGAVLIGSCTLNNGMFPSIADVLTYMKGLKPLNKLGAAFGSYGWSGEAVKYVTQELEAMKFEMVDPGLKVQWIPTDEQIEACYELGKKVAARLSEVVG